MKRTIKQRFIFAGAFTVVSMLLGYSLSIQAKGKEEVSLKDEITFIEIESPNKFEVQFKENGKKTGIVIFQSKLTHIESILDELYGKSKTSDFSILWKRNEDTIELSIDELENRIIMQFKPKNTSNT